MSFTTTTTTTRTTSTTPSKRPASAKPGTPKTPKTPRIAAQTYSVFPSSVTVNSSVTAGSNIPVNNTTVGNANSVNNNNNNNSTPTSFAPTSTYTRTPPPRGLRRKLPSSRGTSGIASLSTPNLGSLFNAHARGVPPVPSLPPQQPLPAIPGAGQTLPVPKTALRSQSPSRAQPPARSQSPTRAPSRAQSPIRSQSPAIPQPLRPQRSLAALTSKTLSAVPDATESYAFDVLKEPPVPAIPSPYLKRVEGRENEGAYPDRDNENTHNDRNLLAPSVDSASASPSPSMPPTPRLANFGASFSSYSTAPTAPGDDVSVGDTVDVPGGMNGTVRFVGSVAGRKGVFAGVELHPEFATRGKNSGDVDGVSYFNTAVPGAGIFLPLNKAVRRDYPQTPTNGAGLKLGSQNSVNFTPPTPSLPKFSQSVSAAGGAGPARAASPSNRRAASPTARRPRTSLPRPDSPVRRLQMTPGSRPSIQTPAARPAGANNSRYGSPTPNKFSQSMRAPTAGGAGDPAKKGAFGLKPDRKLSLGPRSASALSGPAGHFTDDDSTPVGSRTAPNTAVKNTSTNGSVGSVSSFNQKMRPASRAAGHVKNGSSTSTNNNGVAAANAASAEEMERLRTELEDRDRQLKDQANTLADMESSLTELQTLIEGSDLGPGGGLGGGGGPDDDPDAPQLRALLREKNEKIAMLTAEFDAHRADFRSTIDTLEMASTETERVYEKKIEELMQEIHDLENRTSDVDAVAHQLKQLEELVQELEEGLEDARRGEVEARGEVEFLRGEIERTRTELRREREKVAVLTAEVESARDSTSNNKNRNSGAVQDTATAAAAALNSSKELESKDDEIRGLKAIIHSLSQNANKSSGAAGDAMSADPKSPKRTSWRSSSGGVGGTTANGMRSSGGGSGANGPHRRGESISERMAREKLEREVAELRSMLDTKSTREAEMERELQNLRGEAGPVNGANVNGVNGVNGHAPGLSRTSTLTAGSRSSLRDSRGTVVLAQSPTKAQQNHTPTSSHGRNGSMGSLKGNLQGSLQGSRQGGLQAHHHRNSTLDTMHESDAYSSVTESSTLWCEICETNGHDILTCTNMFPEARAPAPAPAPNTAVNNVAARAAPAPVMANGDNAAHADKATTYSSYTPTSVPPEVKILPNPMESGPVAGKESGVVDADKWCALCERDGHDSVDCPFEDAF